MKFRTPDKRKELFDMMASLHIRDIERLNRDTERGYPPTLTECIRILFKGQKLILEKSIKEN